MVTRFGMNSLIDQQTYCYRELLSEFVDSPIGQQTFVIGRSYQSSWTPWSTNKTFVIGSSHQSSLIPKSTNKLLAVGSSYQISWAP